MCICRVKQEIEKSFSSIIGVHNDGHKIGPDGFSGIFNGCFPLIIEHQEDPIVDYQSMIYHRASEDTRSLLRSRYN